jgi:hypothetical protein
VILCTFEGSATNATAKITPSVDAPSLGDIRLEPSISSFGYLEASFGSVFAKSARFEFVKAKAGATLAGSFAIKESQLADASYASSYKLSLDTSVGTGAKMGVVLQMLGVPDITAVEIKASRDIAKSPTGLASGAVTADKTTFLAGEVINFSVKLDPTTTDFLPLVGPYNVKRVQLVRKTNPNLTIVPVVETINATPGQTQFTFSHTASSAGDTSQFSAFVVTTLAPFDFLSLEIGTVAAPSSTVLTGVYAGTSTDSSEGLKGGPGVGPSTQLVSGDATRLKISQFRFGSFQNSGAIFTVAPDGTLTLVGSVVDDTSPVRPVVNVTISGTLRNGRLQYTSTEVRTCAICAIDIFTYDLIRQ